MKSRVLAALPAALLLAGCTNLGAVSSLSQNLMSAADTWSDVGREFKATCERHRQFNPKVTSCDGPTAASEGLVGANAVLSAYFGALHATANESNFTVQPGLDTLAASAGAIPGANADQVKAVAGLAGLLARWGTEALREDTLRILIRDGSPDARRTIALLEQTVPAALETSLGAEREAMSEQLAGYILTAGQAPPTQKDGKCDLPPRTSAFTGPNWVIALEYCERLERLDAKLKAVSKYRASLAAADKALDELNSAKTRLGAKELAGKLYKAGKDLNDNAKAVRKAYSKETDA